MNDNSLNNENLLKKLEENIKLIEELENQRDFNNTLIQTNPAFFVAIQSNGKLLMMNNTMLKALGYTKKEVLDKDYSTTFVPMEEREMLSNTFQKLSRLHQHTLNENHVLTKDGRKLLVEWHGAPIFKGNNFDYFIGIGIDITERKKVDSRIKCLSKIFEESLNEIYIFDSKTYKFLYVNNGAKKNIGYSNEELLNLTPLDVKPEFTNESFEKLIEPIKDKLNKKIKFETVHKRKDGSLYNVEVHLQQTIFEEKDVFFAIIVDITARKESELLLKESEKKYRELFEKSDDAILIIENNKFVDCNNSAVKMLRYNNKDELLNTHPSELSPKYQSDGRNSYEKAEELMSIAFKKGSYRFEWDHKKADGKIFPVEVLLTSISSGNGNKILHVVWRDISDRKQAELELRNSQKRLSSHLDNTPLAAIFWDRNFKVIDWNKSAENIFGYKKSEAVGKHANDLIVPKELKDQIMDIFKRLLANTGGQRSTNENITKDGKRILCVWYNAAIIDTTGYVTGVASLVEDVTIRKQNIDELKKSETKFELLLENMPNAVFLTQLGGEEAGKIIYANPAAEKQTGYRSSDLVGMNIINNFFVEQDTKALKDNREDGLKKGEILSFIEKKKRADGSIYLTQVMVTSIEYKHKMVTLSVNTDITKQIQAQEKIQESEKKYKSLFENNYSPVFTTSIDGKILECNNAFVEMFGYQTKEEIYKINAKVLHKSQASRKLFLEKLKDQKFISNFETNGIKKDGTVISILISANLISDIIIQGTIFNITDIKKYQAEILKLSRGIEQSPDMIIITDLEGNIEYANPKISEATGYSNEELIGQNPRIFASGKTPKIVYEELWGTILSGKTWKGELLNKRKNGETYWESVNIAPIIDNEGNILNYIGVKNDITEKKEITVQLIRAKEKAEELYKLKSNFLANMSHELRTPLAGILGFTEILEEDIKDEELKKIANLVNENGKRLLETLNLILNLSKIESEAMEIEFTEFDVIQEIKRSAKIFEVSAAKKNILINVNSNLDSLIIYSDVRIFYEIMNNLINNAVKYTTAGSVNVYVDISNNDKFVVIKVIDTGIGIPEDKQKLIWEEFRQVSEGASRVFEGAGLGLTITNKYIQKLKGKIEVESELGKGSTFTVYIPKNVKFHFVTPSEPKIVQNEKNDINVNTTVILPKLLYVEDDNSANAIVKRFLTGKFDIHFAKNGIEGFVKVKAIPFDIILMDIDLKYKPNGIELTKHIRKLKGYKTIPIIAVSAYSFSANKKELYGSGFTSYLAKPFTKDALISTLAKALGK